MERGDVTRRASCVRGEQQRGHHNRRRCETPESPRDDPSPRQRLQRSGSRAALPAPRPRGDRRQQQALRDALSVVRPRGRRAGRRRRQGRRGLPGRCPRWPPEGAFPAGRCDPNRFAGNRIQGGYQRRRDSGRGHAGLPQPDAKRRYSWRPGLPAEHRRVADWALALQRGHPGLRQRDRRRKRPDSSRRERPKVLEFEPWRDQTRAGQEDSLLRQSMGHRLHQRFRSRHGVRRLRGQRSPGQGHGSRRRQAGLHRRREHHPLYRSERSGQLRHQRGEGRQEPARYRHHERRLAGLRPELRFAQRLGGRLAAGRRGRHHPDCSPAPERVPGRSRSRRRRDVLLVAGSLRSPAGHQGLHGRAPVQGRLAELRELPLQGAHRRRRLGLQHRLAQIGAAERDLQSSRQE